MYQTLCCFKIRWYMTEHSFYVILLLLDFLAKYNNLIFHTSRDLQSERIDDFLASCKCSRSWKNFHTGTLDFRKLSPHLLEQQKVILRQKLMKILSSVPSGSNSLISYLPVNLTSQESLPGESICLRHLRRRQPDIWPW